MNSTECCCEFANSIHCYSQAGIYNRNRASLAALSIIGSGLLLVGTRYGDGSRSGLSAADRGLRALAGAIVGAGSYGGQSL